jgi:hypothetical protein
MVKGFDAGAGPSPRIDGAGVPDCATSLVVAIAAAHKQTTNRKTRMFIDGFYQAAFRVNYGIPFAIQREEERS